MHDTAKFHFWLEMDSCPWSHISGSFCILKQLHCRIKQPLRLSLFMHWKLSWVAYFPGDKVFKNTKPIEDISHSDDDTLVQEKAIAGFHQQHEPPPPPPTRNCQHQRGVHLRLSSYLIPEGFRGKHQVGIRGQHHSTRVALCLFWALSFARRFPGSRLLLGPPRPR